MEQSLIAAVSGIAADQAYLDVVGNNVANSNTTAYKSESAQFTDLLAQQVAGASAPVPGGQGAGINPLAIGSGVRVGAVSLNESQGAIQTTNVPTDVAIQGSGFLVTKQYGQTMYTRDGSLTLDANGNLGTQTGGLVQGWAANAQGVVNTNAPTGAISIPTGTTMPASATTEMTLGGNLPAWSGTGTATPITTTINAYDSLGNVVPVSLTFTPVAGSANKWTVQGTVPNASGAPTNLWTTAPTISFGASTGQISSVTGATTNADGSLSLPVQTMPSNYAFPTGDTWNINFPNPTGAGAVTQYSGQQSLSITSADGAPSGSLAGFSIGSDGVITGSFSNGKTLAIGQIALAQFSNPGGLSPQGNLNYIQSPNSGQPAVGVPGTNGSGTLIGGALEGSNVNLSSQLTDLIVAQEAYQANTKVVSTTAMNLTALSQMA